jgi:hypothetical protein
MDAGGVITEADAINETIEHLSESLFENLVINHFFGTVGRTITIWAVLHTQGQLVENCRQAGTGDAICGCVTTPGRGRGGRPDQGGRKSRSGRGAGRGHRFAEYACDGCGKKGHIRRGKEDQPAASCI